MNSYSNSLKFLVIALSMSFLAGCGGSSDSSTGASLARNSYTDLFASTTFHPRCVNCHTFAEGGVSAQTHVGFSTNCAECHDQEDWRASIQDMTTTGRTASEVCNIAVQRRGSKEALATVLRTSPHVRWSIAEGDLPGGAMVPLAPPRSHATWLAMVDTWVAAGSSCD